MAEIQREQPDDDDRHCPLRVPDRARVVEIGEKLRCSYQAALSEDVPDVLRDLLKELE